ncbi:MAG: 2-succinyl-5-enolpyruvyl-6-hydroxy-3-cyclohexene-1-carboxylic-acid synthase [Bacteroidetes bacterium]|nr:2-succinyl-5-enolpyruvyl-6-hydroxy-3-cyclohexene-1-carboxylic-acid synthase [Bacteroidota bacterium]
MKQIVLSPGSRNAPIIKAFTQHGHIQCHSVVDERSAAYIALGMALKSGNPTGIACTSGTAVLNYAPAIAEAYYQGIPLIVITADRPEELIDQGDGQSIRQQNVFANFVKAGYHLPAKTDTNKNLWHFNKLVCEALDIALADKPGPVHINVPLHEPLYDELPAQQSDIHLFSLSKAEPRQYQLPENMAVQWQNSQQKMVIIGYQHPSEKLHEQLVKLMADQSVVIIAENLANQSHKNFISSVERLFCVLENTPLLPDHIICLGGDVLSKQAKRVLRQNPPKHNWNVASYYNPKDTFQSLTQIIQTAPVDFVDKLTELPTRNSSYQQEILKLDRKLYSKQHRIVQESEFSDLKVFDLLMNHLPIPCNLHLGNSSPVRYAQLFQLQEGITYYSNRGVSGIDGPLSTAIGVALESTAMNILIIGDISFLYDSNALWYTKFPSNLKVIVINNGGGDIFRIIDSDKQLQETEPFFTTPQSVSLKLLTEACRLKYAFANTMDELNRLIPKLFDTKENISVLEINTSLQPNSLVLQQLYYQFKTYKHE